jgi:hypothetical protein
VSSPTTLKPRPYVRLQLPAYPEVNYTIEFGVSLWDLEISKSGENPQNPLSDSDTANPYPYSTSSPAQQREADAWPNFTAQDNISSATFTPEDSSPSTLALSSSESPSEAPQPSFTTATPASTQSCPQSSSPEQLEEGPPLSVALIPEAQTSPTPSIHTPIPAPTPSPSPGKSQYQCFICSKTFDRRYKLQ